MENRTIVNIKDLTKIYAQRRLFRKKFITAVDGLNLQIGKSEVFGLLGPNGAGKTTTMKMLIGITCPTKGTIDISIDGFDSKTDYNLRCKIGFLSESPVLPEHLRVKELLRFYSKLFGISKEETDKEIDDILDMVSLKDKAKDKIKNLSIGQKRTLGLAQALINDPELLILDEPTVYLDPLILEKFHSIILNLKQKGKTIIISSHILSEIERLCDRIAIINKGRLVAEGDIEKLTQEGSLDEFFLKVIKKDHKDEK